ncbi:hypothetical protein EBN88_01990, partial [Streptomyces triticirhizae]
MAGRRGLERPVLAACRRLVPPVPVRVAGRGTTRRVWAGRTTFPVRALAHPTSPRARAVGRPR